MEALAPIVLFTYNRLKNTRETVSCLLANSEAGASDLIVYSDAPKNEKAAESVQAVRDYLHTVTGFKSVTLVEREVNYGLVRNITSGVTEVIGRYGRVIVLEDDHSVSPYFLKYMNEGLERFAGREDIACIHGYVYPHKDPLPEAFLVKGADCWGWATWERAWKIFDMDAARMYNEIVRQGRGREFDFNGSYPYMKMLKDQAAGTKNSWAICWYASAFLQDMYTVYPGESLVNVNSLSDGGEHDVPSKELMRFSVDLKKTPVDWAQAETETESPAGRKAFERFFRSQMSVKQRIIAFIKHMLSNQN
jgi:Predicted glycosyltransferases